MATIRQEIIDLLQEGAMTALDISQAVGVAEKDVYYHLAHIQKTVAGQGRKLVLSPVNVRHADFVSTSGSA